VIVVDASAVVDSLIPGARRRNARAALGAGDGLLAPAIIDAEVLSALARLERADVITTAEADFAAAALGDLPVERIELSGLLGAAWSLRRSVRLTDALYVSLAVRLACPLLTSDLKLAKAPIRGVHFRTIESTTR
jgi:predicted nucleic acid-binding protein